MKSCLECVMNNHQRLQELLKTANLEKHESAEVWRLMKKQGVSAAEAYIASHAKPLPVITAVDIRPEPIPYQIWGREQIEEGAHEQMRNSARLPITLAGALMPDAHQGYGLPIGGVLATDNVVIPYAVGVDIACRMMLTVYPVEPPALNRPREKARLEEALLENTVFGAGADGLHEGKIEHEVLDMRNWTQL